MYGMVGDMQLGGEGASAVLPCDWAFGYIAGARHGHQSSRQSSPVPGAWSMSNGLVQLGVGRRNSIELALGRY